MSSRGDVSYRVKRAVGFIPRFTIAQLADATGLTYEQVEQVVRRMKDHEIVGTVDEAEFRGPEGEYVRRVGRPRKIYALTEDRTKRNEFFASLEAIESAVRLGSASERRPSTVYYEAALEIIRALESGEEEPLESRMHEAASLLEYGWRYEGLIPEGAEVAQAYYDLALGQLRALTGEHEVAQNLLRRARETFDNAGLGTEVRMVDERGLCLRVSRYLGKAVGSSDHIVSVGALQKAAALLEQSDFLDEPPFRLLHDSICMLLNSLPERTWEERVDEYSDELVERFLSKLDTELSVRRVESELVMTMEMEQRFQNRFGIERSGRRRPDRGDAASRR